MSAESEKNRRNGRVNQDVGRPEFINPVSSELLLQKIQAELERLSTLIADFGGVVCFYPSESETTGNKITVRLVGHDPEELFMRGNVLCSVLLADTKCPEIFSTLQDTSYLITRDEDTQNQVFELVVYRDYPDEAEFLLGGDEMQNSANTEYGRSLYESRPEVSQTKYAQILTELGEFVFGLSVSNVKILATQKRGISRMLRKITLRISGSNEAEVITVADDLWSSLSYDDFSPEISSSVGDTEFKFKNYKNRVGGYIDILVYSDYLSMGEFAQGHGRN